MPQNQCIWISTHALTWSATEYLPFCTATIRFQLTHSRGVRPPILGSRSPNSYFNSRTHVECDVSTLNSISILLHFNSRTHVECDLYRCSADYIHQNFNSRTHVECDLFLRHSADCFIISTHALTWSATQSMQGQINCNSISTHALTWSATLLSFLIFGIKNFNSRTHVECDCKNFLLTLGLKDFNSRTHVECDVRQWLERI